MDCDSREADLGTKQVAVITSPYAPCIVHPLFLIDTSIIMTNIKTILVSLTSIIALVGIGLPSMSSVLDTDRSTNTEVIESTSTFSPEDNKAAARMLYDIWSEGNLDKVDTIVAEDYASHSRLPGVTPDREGLKQWMAGVRVAFPDVHFTVEHQVAEGDFVVTRWSATGTHKGEMMGFAPTGKKSKVTGINITRYENGKSVEAWGEWDALGMVQSMGGMQPADK